MSAFLERAPEPSATAKASSKAFATRAIKLLHLAHFSSSSDTSTSQGDGASASASGPAACGEPAGEGPCPTASTAAGRLSATRVASGSPPPSAAPR